MTNATGIQRLADDCDVPVSMVRSALWWLEWKVAAASRPDGRWFLTQERRMANEVEKLLKKQMQYLLEALKAIVPEEGSKGVRFIETKALNDELKRIMDGLPQEAAIVTTVKRNALLGLLKGGNRVHRELRLGKVGISFNVKHPDAVNYLSGLQDIHLSQRHGSINAYTRRAIIDIVRDGVQNGDSYTTLAKKIKAQGDAGVFSAARAEMIAVNQLATAYETGKAIVADEAERIVGDIMMCAWQTVGDERVTQECRRNQQAGWIPKGTPFPSGQTHPPRFPRCRCSGRYDFAQNLRLTGQLTPDAIASLPAAPVQQVQSPPPESVAAMNAYGTAVSVPVEQGHVYHATPVRNIESIAKTGLAPRLTKLDQDQGSTQERVYFGVNPGVTGTGLDMNTDTDVTLRVRSDALRGAHIDPHIPSELSLFITHGIKPEDIEVQDQFGRWIPLLVYVQTLSIAA